METAGALERVLLFFRVRQREKSTENYILREGKFLRACVSWKGFFNLNIFFSVSFWRKLNISKVSGIICLICMSVKLGFLKKKRVKNETLCCVTRARLTLKIQKSPIIIRSTHSRELQKAESSVRCAYFELKAPLTFSSPHTTQLTTSSSDSNVVFTI